MQRVVVISVKKLDLDNLQVDQIDPPSPLEIFDRSSIANDDSPQPASKNTTCLLCHTLISATVLEQHGTLMNCKHVFWVPCIKEWRERSDVPERIAKSCPVCKSFSEFVLPLKRRITSGTAKRKLVERYQKGDKENKKSTTSPTVQPTSSATARTSTLILNPDAKAFVSELDEYDRAYDMERSKVQTN